MQIQAPSTSYQITDVYTHSQPSIDELVAIWVLVQFGWANYDVKIHFGPVSTFKTKAVEMKLLKQGKIYLGIGGGMFDEHPTCYRKRVKGECAATLLGQFMGIRENPSLSQIFQLALNDDLGIGPEDRAGKVLAKFSLPAYIKMMYRNEVWDFEQIKEFAFQMLNEHYECQELFWGSKGECELGESFDLRFRGKPYSLLKIKSENPKAAEYAIAKLHYSLVLQIRNSGNWQIFSSKYSDLKTLVPYIAARLKQREACLCGIKYDPTNLMEEGSLPGLDSIYFFKAGGMIFNGSLTHQAKPSRLDPHKIPYLIEELLHKMATLQPQKRSSQTA
ncbi:MAG TPA: hypothetical protein PKD79_02800 [Candidatus Doudnabacteria bacterium]|nr:hypothetical protein [Candidatus Doudnabacteria bacterium]